MSMTIVILAGGLATRLKSLSKNIPKSLVSVGGKPFIDWQIEMLVKQKIKKIIILTGYLGEMIEEYIGDGSRYNASVSYSKDWPKLLGTGGAIKKACNILPDTFFVMYGDTYLSINFNNLELFIKKNNIKNLMTVYKNKNLYDRSNLILEDNKIRKYVKKDDSDKAEFIDYGLSFLQKKYFINFKKNKFDLSEIFIKLINDKLLYHYECHDRFYEIGRPESLKSTQSFFIK